jgi:cytochrome c biogenesis protein CcdA/glutaredoxin
MTKRPALQQLAINLSTCKVFALALILLIIAAPVVHAESTTLFYFYENGCLKCEKASPVIENVLVIYNDINYSKYEISSSFSLARQYGVTTVPAVVINQSVLIEYDDYGGNTDLLNELIIEGIKNAAPISDGHSLSASNQSGLALEDGKTPILIFVAGLLAGFNPCLLAVMAFLASAIVSSNGSRRDMLVLVMGFCAGIFVTYMVVGFGILNTISYFPEMQDIITSSMILLVAFLGLWHIYDAYYMKIHSHSSFKTPRALINFMGAFEGKNILVVSFVGGGLFSLVKAPCVGAVYLTILEMLISGNNPVQSTLYMAIYNFAVVLPILVLGAFLAFGLDPAKLNNFRETRRVEIRLATGIILILLALLLNFNII